MIDTFYLVFPPQEAIVLYLKQHRQTSHYSQKIIEPVAQAFANQSKGFMQVDRNVKEIINELKWANKFDTTFNYQLEATIDNITEALKTCATRTNRSPFLRPL